MSLTLFLFGLGWERKTNPSTPGLSFLSSVIVLKHGLGKLPFDIFNNIQLLATVTNNFLIINKLL